MGKIVEAFRYVWKKDQFGRRTLFRVTSSGHERKVAWLEGTTCVTARVLEPNTEGETVTRTFDGWDYSRDRDAAKLAKEWAERIARLFND